VLNHNDVLNYIGFDGTVQIFSQVNCSALYLL